MRNDDWRMRAEFWEPTNSPGAHAEIHALSPFCLTLTWTLHSQNATKMQKLRNSANWEANGSAHNWCSTNKWREHEHGWTGIDCQKLTSHGLWSFESGNVLPNSSQATARESPTFITDKNRLPSSIAAISVDPENTFWYWNLMMKFCSDSWNN